MNFRRFLGGLAVAALFAAGLAPALAQSTQPPQVTTINPGDLFQDVVNGAAQTGNVYASASTMGGFTVSLPTHNNALIGGDATTNLFQRGTTGASETTTVAYGGPDRFAYWSGTSTAMTVSRDSTAADLPATSYLYGFKMARTSGQTGVVPVCMAQEVESANSYQFQGQVAEFDFHAAAGANFSAANNALTAYIITGTGSDEGVSKLAFGLNAGGGGSQGWAGQANAAADIATLTTTPTRFVAVGVIPATATEIAVAVCYTPVGTAGTNDYVALAGLQLIRNPSLASIASSAVAMPCGTGTGFVACASFDRRPIGSETTLQQRYFYQITDSIATTQRVALGQATTTTAAVFIIPFPTTMRAAPTATASATTAFGETATAGTVTACTAFAVVATATTTQAGTVTCTTGATMTAGGASQLVGENTTANVNFSAEL